MPPIHGGWHRSLSGAKSVIFRLVVQKSSVGKKKQLRVPPMSLRDIGALLFSFARCTPRSPPVRATHLIPFSSSTSLCSDYARTLPSRPRQTPCSPAQILHRPQPLPPSPLPHRYPPQPAAAVSLPCAHPCNAAHRVDAATPPHPSASLRHSTTSVLRSPFSVLCSLHSAPPLRHSATRPLDHSPRCLFNPSNPMRPPPTRFSSRSRRTTPFPSPTSPPSTTPPSKL